ncbi:MAG: hypothetical protein HY775_09715 [Acidobacteria bacterium]|nr:hypothetical protein [Acidobacteriota bacterium]
MAASGASGGRGPEFDRVLRAAARLQSILQDAVLVGGSAAAHHAGHRMSLDDDHVLPDLSERFEQALEATKGWVTARVRHPVLLDLVALADRMGEGSAQVLLGLDDYYADQIGAGGQRVATQLAKQLAEPAPYDLSEVDLRHYRDLRPRWRDWGAVVAAARRLATDVLDLVSRETP